ncbi:MAG: 2-phosphosulfolactate phosphatase [Phycisphaerales bacterium]
MPAPDLPPPPPHTLTERPLAVYLTPRSVAPEALADMVVIVIDALRASVTMTAALARGATRIVPVLTVGEARAAAASLTPGTFLLGGERGGQRIEGFDLDNSPLGYTPERVCGKTIVFTTTNGTASLLHARFAARILVGSFANLNAVCESVAADPRPVHILCAGTRDEASLDDCLPAGAMVELLARAGRQLVAEDSARLCLAAWQSTAGSPSKLVAAMRSSRGGRNLVRLGLDADIEFCSRIDSLPVLPRFDPASGEVRLAAP